MPNPYYNHGAQPIANSSGASAIVRAEFDAITAAFALLPALNASTAVVVDPTGKFLTTTTGAFALAASVTFTGAFATTFVASAATTITLPSTSGTLMLTTAAAGSALVLTTARTIGMTGDLTWTSPAFDGSASVTAVGTLASVATAGTNTKVTFNAKGLVTSAVAAVLASGDFSNQGTTTTLLHGAAAGNPSWAAVSLTADVSGILPTANGGTGIAFFTAAGPTVARVYTFPDAATTILTTNAAVTVSQGGTGLATLTANALYVGAGTSVPTAIAVPASGTLLQGVAAATPVWTATPTLGVASTTTGQLIFATSAAAFATTIQAGTNTAAWTLTLPTGKGTNLQVLQTDGNGLTSWVAQTGGAGGVTQGLLYAQLANVILL